MEDILRILGTVTQTIIPVAVKVLEGLPADPDTETASEVQIIRTTSAITQSVISHLTLMSQELPSNEEAESVPFEETVRNTAAIVQSLTSDIAHILREDSTNLNTNTEHASNAETASEFETVIESVVSNDPPDENTETPDTKTMCNVQPATLSFLPTTDEKLEESTTCQMDETDPDMNSPNSLNSVTQPTVSETTETLEKDMSNDKETVINAPKITDIIPLRKTRDGLNHYLNGDHQSGKNALVSASREAVLLCAGAIGFTYFGETGASFAGMLSGTMFDLIHSEEVGSEKPKGVWVLKDSVTPENIQNAADRLISDGLAGYVGGKTTERTVRSSEIDAFERVKQRRANLGLNDPVANMEVWTEVKDLKTGKIYYGINKNIRRKAKLTEPRDPKPNIYVENYPIEESLPIQREAQTCAETHAFHQMLKDQPDADVTNTQVHTFVLFQDGTYKNITRCANCLIRSSCMGKVPTDVAVQFLTEITKFLVQV